mmetsp:Transcript_107383/g.313989  ORF Transcript_107383/g.313989 Transcript_107383/m.313989 type:complete len:350 (-) Transcript_107383:809-1858(-)
MPAACARGALRREGPSGPRRAGQSFGGGRDAGRAVRRLQGPRLARRPGQGRRGPLRAGEPGGLRRFRPLLRLCAGGRRRPNATGRGPAAARQVPLGGGLCRSPQQRAEGRRAQAHGGAGEPDGVSGGRPRGLRRRLQPRGRGHLSPCRRREQRLRVRGDRRGPGGVGGAEAAARQEHAQHHGQDPGGEGAWRDRRGPSSRGLDRRGAPSWLRADLQGRGAGDEAAEGLVREGRHRHLRRHGLPGHRQRERLQGRGLRAGLPGHDGYAVPRPPEEAGGLLRAGRPGLHLDQRGGPRERRGRRGPHAHLRERRLPHDHHRDHHHPHHDRDDGDHVNHDHVDDVGLPVALLL